MNYYQEITLIEGDKILYEIWSDVFNQIHIALADIKNKYDTESIGISFSNYRYEEKNGQTFATLGDKLRLFAPSQKDLETLNLDKWLTRLTDYVHIKGIKEVGNNTTGYVSVHRYRFKPVDIQVKSLANKMGVSSEEAIAIVAKRKPELKLPFIRMYSESNKTHYPLQILQQASQEQVIGKFNVYGMNGMSNAVTVPQW
ncbi:type I-F CRISPR-associated endoribonuclease Cas6/Csy4 [Psychrobacter cryohalolentis]|uniref:type I-F CRISPR-associated endoribonuclease Cas6/Csy4 n=1 Tax=Psychrobacter cryohalolentis TaxID=330922 RepID=UPI003F8717C7